MLLLMCQVGSNRYAIDSCNVREVLPRVNLHRLSGDAPWLAGLLIHRGAAIPVLDLTQLTEQTPCPNRLSCRILIVETDLSGAPRNIGLLVEQVGLAEIQSATKEESGEQAGSTALGRLCLDDQGIFQLIDLSRLVPESRQAVLFPAAVKGR
jgi:chemotaxis-related protein WspB